MRGSFKKMVLDTRYIYNEKTDKDGNTVKSKELNYNASQLEESSVWASMIGIVGTILMLVGLMVF